MVSAKEQLTFYEKLFSAERFLAILVDGKRIAFFGYIAPGPIYVYTTVFVNWSIWTNWLAGVIWIHRWIKGHVSKLRLHGYFYHLVHVDTNLSELFGYTALNHPMYPNSFLTANFVNWSIRIKL